MNALAIGQLLRARLITDEICEAKVTNPGSPLIEIEFISGSHDGDRICVHEEILINDNQ